MNAKKGTRVAIYARVSTDGQTVNNQLEELRSVADRHGWIIAAEFIDRGISGAKGRDKRPQFDAMLKAANRREFDMIASWSVDRLGRSLQHLVEFLSDIHAKGIDLFLHQQGLDTSTPSGKAMFQMLGVFAEFERAMIRERVQAGLKRARKEGKTLGRPTLERAKGKKGAELRMRAAKVRALKGKGLSPRKIAEQTGVSHMTVRRILAEN